MKTECTQQEGEFNELSQEFKELVQNCSEDEAAILSDRFERLMAGYSKVEDLIKNRESLCGQWTKYYTAHKDIQGKLKMLQAKLQSPDIKEDEVLAINREVEVMRKGMIAWAKQADRLDDLMTSAQLVIKDRATQRTLHFGSELQALESLCDSVSFTVKQREEHLGELTQLWDEFEAKKGTLVAKLQNVGQRIDSAAVEQSTLQGIKELVREVEVSVTSENL